MAKATGEYIGKVATRVLLDSVDRMDITHVDIKYDTMNNLLSKTNNVISVSELMTLLGVKPVYSEPEYETIIDLCRQLSVDALKKCLQIADQLVTDWQREPKMDKLQPSERIFALVERRRRGHDRVTDAPVDLARAWVDHHRGTRVPFAAIPETCAYLNASPHWIMRLSDDVPYYCKDTPLIDVILDRYSFIPKKDKKLFIALLNDLCERKG